MVVLTDTDTMLRYCSAGEAITILMFNKFPIVYDSALSVYVTGTYKLFPQHQ